MQQQSQWTAPRVNNPHRNQRNQLPQRGRGGFGGGRGGRGGGRGGRTNNGGYQNSNNNNNRNNRGGGGGYRGRGGNSNNNRNNRGRGGRRHPHQQQQRKKKVKKIQPPSKKSLIKNLRSAIDSNSKKSLEHALERARHFSLKVDSKTLQLLLESLAKVGSSSIIEAMRAVIGLRDDGKKRIGFEINLTFLLSFT